MALALVVPADHAAHRGLEAQHRLHALRDGRQHLAFFGAPGAVVARLFLVGHLALAQGVEFFHAHIARIDKALGLQLRQHFLVAVHALHLVERAFVVVELQPRHAFDDHIDRCLRGTLHVGVFDAQDEVALVGARKRPGVQGRADVAQVDEAGGRRGETGAYFFLCHVSSVCRDHAADRP
ncbi:hypothetical protein SDC9_181807 [bioreactor metagenome]|uniref:Uncharacterized protein n=1 Tax=bioreactor metagenome TaxID=1076179 RepID=A0A645HDY7_9ZZZZ